MRQCWNWNPNARPTFAEIVDNLDKVLSSTTPGEYLELENVPFLDEHQYEHSDDEEFSVTTYQPIHYG